MGFFSAARSAVSTCKYWGIHDQGFVSVVFIIVYIILWGVIFYRIVRLFSMADQWMNQQEKNGPSGS